MVLRRAALTATWLLLAPLAAQALSPVGPQPAAQMPVEVPAVVPVADLLSAATLASLSLPAADQSLGDRASGDLALAQRLGPASLAYPLAQPALQIDPWGWRPADSRGAWRMHTGVDFAAPKGTPVLAALGGVVVLAEEISGYGLTVVIDHGQGLQTLYAHLQQIDAPLGTALIQGQRLGSIGMTGRTTGPHLHFELRSRGSQSVAHDPIPYLPPLLPPPALTAVRP